mgnify:CR=1 FL=1
MADVTMSLEEYEAMRSLIMNVPSTIASLSEDVVVKKRKASAYSKRYARAFKKVQGQFKLKSGAWAKNGFKRAQKAAHAMAKKK